jgi:aspartyl-tRNA(Asn)/glutamyl-tRNA(Gln) amidotransferase subunit B
MATTAGTRYETVIGIEVHAQLKTESKMFCSCPTSAPEGQPDEPNTRVCPICLGMPGTLPAINRRAVELVMLTGIALECHIETEAVRFERKNYFYPDLPKGYQISQYALPLCSNGRLNVPVPSEEAEVSIGITRAHLEEDTARLQHGGRGYSLVDFNRAGVPLMEIVTEPDVRSAAQARAYGETLRDILRYIGASDGDMETGSMRIEGNISLRPMGSDRFGTKVEVKNLNSFRSLERAMEFEVARHTEALRAGEPLVQETRGWEENAGRTIVQRSKEEANDYRYFPEPDLPPLRPSPSWVAELRAALPSCRPRAAADTWTRWACPTTTLTS